MERNVLLLPDNKAFMHFANELMLRDGGVLCRFIFFFSEKSVVASLPHHMVKYVAYFVDFNSWNCWLKLAIPLPSAHRSLSKFCILRKHSLADCDAEWLSIFIRIIWLQFIGIVLEFNEIFFSFHFVSQFKMATFLLLCLRCK